MKHLLIALACSAAFLVCPTESLTADVVFHHQLSLSRLDSDKTDKKAEEKDNKKAAEEKDFAAEAAKLVGKEWTVEFTVKSTGQTRNKSRVFLNSEKQYYSKRNLTIVLDMKALSEDLKKAKITEPMKHFDSKKVRVTGKVSLYNNRPQLVVEKLEQIKEAK